MFTLALIGFFGGLITGISPCILPVLPVIFFSGTQGARSEPVAESDGGTAVAVETKPALSDRLRPYRVIGGLVLSFSLVTLVGSLAAVASASSAGRDPLGGAHRADRSSASG